MSRLCIWQFFATLYRYLVVLCTVRARFSVAIIDVSAGSCAAIHMWILLPALSSWPSAPPVLRRSYLKLEGASSEQGKMKGESFGVPSTL